VFHGSGCYTVPYGIVLRQPVTIDGGTFVDSTTVPGPPPGQKGYGGLRPIFKVLDTHHVTIQNVNVIGSNSLGGFHPPLVNQAGIDVLSSDHVTIANVTTLNTYGDGLEFWFSTPGRPPATNVTVRNVTITNAGRQGITTGYLYGATFTNVTVASSTDTSIDAESDLPRIGMGNVVFNHVTAYHMVNLINLLSGPVSFVNCNFHGRIVDANPTQWPVTVTGGTYAMPASANGYPGSVIHVVGGSLTFDHVAITRPPPRYGAVEGYSWGVIANGHLRFVSSPFTGSPGFADATSTVTILP
jgi:hypothetical protein